MDGLFGDTFYGIDQISEIVSTQELQPARSGARRQSI